MATLKMKYGVISADDHVQEAPDVWTNRMSKAKFGGLSPRHDHLAEIGLVQDPLATGCGISG